MIIESFKIDLSAVREAYLGPEKSEVQKMNDGYISNKQNNYNIQYYQQSTTRVFISNLACMATICICRQCLSNESRSSTATL
jgi:hypothetical protein